MGPNALWLTEALTQVMPIEPYTEGFLHESGKEERAMLEADGGKNLGFAQVVGTKATR